MQTIRRIQVGAKRVHSFPKLGKIPVPSTLKPQLILAGNWLQKAGFNLGDLAQIEVKEKQLIITLA